MARSLMTRLRHWQCTAAMVLMPVSGPIKALGWSETMPVLSLLWCQLSVDRIRGPRIIAVAGNREHLWGEQHRIETRTKRNHSRVNSEYLTLGGNYSRSP